jgi:hypothetical protein
MGIYDYLRCYLPLPTTKYPLPGNTVFQTKNTPNQDLAQYVIAADGRLQLHAATLKNPPPPDRPDIQGEFAIVPYSGPLTFYELLDKFESKDGLAHWWKFTANFSQGYCQSIDLVEER